LLHAFQGGPAFRETSQCSLLNGAADNRSLSASLDGDSLRNAFLNTPWVKAVIPIRTGQERAAFARH
jgi:hypothetical protein